MPPCCSGPVSFDVRPQIQSTLPFLRSVINIPTTALKGLRMRNKLILAVLLGVSPLAAIANTIIGAAEARIENIVIVATGDVRFRSIAENDTEIVLDTLSGGRQTIFAPGLFIPLAASTADSASTLATRTGDDNLSSDAKAESTHGSEPIYLSAASRTGYPGIPGNLLYVGNNSSVSITFDYFASATIEGSLPSKGFAASNIDVHVGDKIFNQSSCMGEFYKDAFNTLVCDGLTSTSKFGRISLSISTDDSTFNNLPFFLSTSTTVMAVSQVPEIGTFSYLVAGIVLIFSSRRGSRSKGMCPNRDPIPSVEA
jgi:hypothetical protein